MFFYFLDKKNIISTMLQSFIALGTISVFWLFIGFSLSFGDSIYGLGIIGDPLQYLNFKGVLSKNENIPFKPIKIMREKWLSQPETKYLKELLAYSKGNIRKAASIAKVNHVTMYRLLKKWQISLRNDFSQEE